METLNIEAAKQYVSSAETRIEEKARPALAKLKSALEASSDSKTKPALMLLARDVEAAQKDGTQEFTTQEFEQHINDISSPDGVEQQEVLPHELRAESIVEKVYETDNETLIDGAEILLSSLNEGLEIFPGLTPLEKENIKIGILGYVFDHYYEALGGLKIADLQAIFTDMTKTFQNIGKVTQKSNDGIVGSFTKRLEGLSGIYEGGMDSFNKVAGILDNTGKIEDTVKKHIETKFGPLFALLSQHRSSPREGNEPDVMAGFLSNPANIMEMEARFPAKTPDELEKQIFSAPKFGQEKTKEMAGKLKGVFENKVAILDKVTGMGKNILDTFADSADTGGPMSWGRDMVSGALKFLAGLPLIGKFVKTLLGLEPTEEIDVYFGDERRFQRVSAKNLRALGESQNSLLTGKNLANVTTKRLTTFTKAYMPHSMDPEQKIPAISPEMWSSIIDKHQIPTVVNKQQVLVPIPKDFWIKDSDFSGNKPGKSFFEKINALSSTPPLGTEPAAPSNAPQGAPAQKPAEGSTDSVEGKTKAQIAEVIIARGTSMMEVYKEQSVDIPVGQEKDFLESQLKLISIALATKDVTKIKDSLVMLNNVTVKKKLSETQKKDLEGMNALITAWEKAGEPVAQTAQPVVAEKSPQNAPDSPSFKDKAKGAARFGLDWLRSKIG